MPQGKSRMARLGLSVVVVFGLLMPLAQAKEPNEPRIKDLFIFGDSLSDTGNLDALTSGLLPATSPPYFDGRFSNGPLWVQTLAAFLGVAVDFDITVVDDPLAHMQAVGGALSDTRNANTILAPEVAGTGVLGQVMSFEDAGGRIKRRDLVIVWGGANDYLADPDTNPIEVVNNLRQAVEDLAALGGRDFVVPNLSDLGDTPFALELGLQETLNRATKIHNRLLAVVMVNLARRQGLDILVLDVNGAFNGLDALFANLTVPCIIQDPPNPPFVTGICPLQPDGVPDSSQFGGSLYMDVVHPTTQAHRLLGAFAFGAIGQAFGTSKRRR